MRRVIGSVLLLCFCALGILAIEPAAQSLIDAGHWKRLRAMAQPRLAANPNDAEAAYLLAYAKFSFGDLDGAIEGARKAVALDSHNADYHCLLGRAVGQKATKVSYFKMMGMANEFKKENEAALSINPSHIEALLDLMGYYFEAPALFGGDVKKAFDIADQIGKINASRGYLAQADLAGRGKTKDWGKIEGLYRKATEADPRSYRALIALASFCASEQAKKYDEGARLARQAMQLDPSRQAAYASLAIMDVFMERWQDLDALLAQAEKNVPDSLNPYYQAARILYLTGRDQPRAERYFRKYLSQEPEGESPHLAAAHWRLGLVLEKEGRKPEAIAEIETGLKLEPEFDAAKKDLKRLK